MSSGRTMWFLYKHLRFLQSRRSLLEVPRQCSWFQDSIRNFWRNVGFAERAELRSLSQFTELQNQNDEMDSKSKLQEIITDTSEISITDDELIWDRILFCKNNGISKEDLKRYPSLLEQNQWELRSKLSMLQNVGVNSATVSLLLLTANRLKRIRSVWNEDQISGNRNRLEILRDLFQCDDAELGEMLLNHPTLLTMNFTRLYQIYHQLKQHRIPPKNIKSDLWIFSHNIKEIEERLHVLSRAGIHDIHMWCLRCNQETFVKYLKKIEIIQGILQSHSNKVSYLSEQLKCDTEYIETELKRRLPQLFRVNLLKLQQIFNLLFSYNVTSEQIIREPRVLCMSAITVESRLKELEEIGYELKSLALLHTTHHKFNKFARIHKKGKETVNGKLSSKK